MPRSADETRALFDAWASTYDADVRQPGGPLEGYAHSLIEAATMLPLEANALVLDIGIGTERFAELVAQRGALISGVDTSEAMLARCREAHPDYTLKIGAFNPIHHEAGQFDAVTASFVFHEVPLSRRQNACHEIARVLKPGGYVCLLDIIFASAAAMAEARRVIGRLWDDDEDYPLVGDLDTRLRAAGFGGLVWRQTAPCHWAVVGLLPGTDSRHGGERMPFG